jgi:hypothetical protein
MTYFIKQKIMYSLNDFVERKSLMLSDHEERAYPKEMRFTKFTRVGVWCF